MRLRVRGDDGQLMLLAGIILTLAFILTALTLSQISALEKEAAGSGPLPIINEWRFLRERLTGAIDIATGPEVTNQTFRETVLPTASASFRTISAERGYDLVVRLADDGNYAKHGNEASLVSGANYDAWTWDGTAHFTHPAYGSTADGIVWQTPCPNASGPAAGCIRGAYIFIRLADATTTMEESILIETNR